MFGRRIRTRSLRERRRKKIIDGVILLLALLGAIVLLVSQLTMIPAVNIQEIVVDGNKAVSERQIRSLVQDEIEGYYLNLFSRSNIILFPRWKIEKDILEKLPRILDADVDMRGLKKIRVLVKEREAVGVWCSGDECYLLDEVGYVFAKAPTFSNQPFFEYRGDILGRESPIKKTFLSPDSFRELRSFVEGLGDINIPVQSLTIVYDDHFEAFLETGGKIIFDPTDGYEAVRENLALVLASNELRHEEGGKLLEIEYIDLRFGNKIFYKLE